MPELFERTVIKGLELKNRAIRSATWSGVTDRKGYVTDRAIAFYSNLAKDGVGLIVTGFQYVMPNGIAMIYQKGNYSEGLGVICKAERKSGSAAPSSKRS